MSDYDESNMPPPEATGDDGPMDNEHELNDVSPEFEDPEPAAAPADDDDDDESLLSEVDEAQFADFDPSAVQVAPDYENLKTIKASKRQRAPGEEAPAQSKGDRREKVKRNKRRHADSDDGFSGGEEMNGKRSRKSKSGTNGERRRPVREEIDESTLPEEERRRRELNRRIDAAVKKTGARRIKKGEIDLEQMADAEIADMRDKMIKAAEADQELVQQGLPASHKLKMLPQVIALLSRENSKNAILDPDNNILEAVRFFLEPLFDGSLPAYNIQRELFGALDKIEMTKDALIASGIGKVIYFYKKSKRAEPKIQQKAEKFMQQWTAPLLSKSDDYRKKQFQSVAFDPARLDELKAVAAVQKKPGNNVGPGKKDTNRARPIVGTASYTIVPQVHHVPTRTR